MRCPACKNESPPQTIRCPRCGRGLLDPKTMKPLPSTRSQLAYIGLVALAAAGLMYVAIQVVTLLG